MSLRPASCGLTTKLSPRAGQINGRLIDAGGRIAWDDATQDRLVELTGKALKGEVDMLMAAYVEVYGAPPK